jgi:hypothetical protein
MVWKFAIPHPCGASIRASFPLELRAFHCAAVALLALYLAVCGFLFTTWVEPSLRGSNEWRVGADSLVYMDVADSWEGGTSLVTPTANFFGPVMLALWLRNSREIAIFDVSLFLFALLILNGSTRYVFIVWILINPLTFPSLLTLNKEILSLFCAVLFWRWMVTKQMLLIVMTISLSSIVRWEQALVLLVFIAMQKIQNRRRALVLLILVISVASPIAHAYLAPVRPGDEQSATTGMLVMLQDYGLYALVLPAKALSALTSQIVQFWQLADLKRLHDLQTGVFVLGDQLCMCAILLFAWRRKLLHLSSDGIYFIAIYVVVYCAAPLNQPRYFFFCYVLIAAMVSSHSSKPLWRMSVPA